MAKKNASVMHHAVTSIMPTRAIYFGAPEVLARRQVLSGSMSARDAVDLWTRYPWQYAEILRLARHGIAACQEIDEEDLRELESVEQAIQRRAEKSILKFALENGVEGAGAIAHSGRLCRRMVQTLTRGGRGIASYRRIFRLEEERLADEFECPYHTADSLPSDCPRAPWWKWLFRWPSGLEHRDHLIGRKNVNRIAGMTAQERRVIDASGTAIECIETLLATTASRQDERAAADSAPLVTEDEQPALTAPLSALGVDEEEITILRALDKNKPRLMTAQQITGHSHIGEKTVRNRLLRLQASKLVDRPRGKNGGLIITDLGTAFLASLPPTAK